MSGRDKAEYEAPASLDDGSGHALLAQEKTQTVTPAASLFPGVLVGELLGLGDGGRTPLVCFPGQSGTAAIAARSFVDLHGPHIGRKVALMFENGDSLRPIVTGVLIEHDDCPFEPRAGQVEVDADGQRLVVNARAQLVLRCGKASITLTSAGKVLIKGAYVLSSSSGVNRIRGGSVQIN
jgi:hypothetical protein